MSKIIHIITRLDKGGSAQNILFTCLALSEKYELILAHGPSFESKMTRLEKKWVDDQVEKLGEKGVRVTTIPSLVRRIDPFCDLWSLFSIVVLLLKEKPAMVHTHSSKAGILGRLAARIASVPIVVHTPHGHVFYGHFGPSLSRLFLLTERLASAVTDRLIALTEAERDDYVRLSVCSPEKIVTIHSGVDVERSMKTKVSVKEKKQSLGIPYHALVVGTVGWLLPVKGPIYLLQAMTGVWENHPEARLLFVGKGDLERDLKREAFRMGAGNKVTFLGWREDTTEIMQVLDIFVLPSLNEGMGRVLVEAMAAGKPLVGSNTGGIPDLIKHGENGLLVRPKDVDGFCAAIKELLDNEEMRHNMGKAGKRMARKFSIETMVQKIDLLYCTLLENKVLGAPRGSGS